MTIALIDNGSLEPAAHLNLRALAAKLSSQVRAPVHAVSWKHSDRIAPGSAGLRPADAEGGRDARAPIWTLAPFIRAQLARGERDFVFVPFFVSAQGAIGSALRNDLEQLQHAAGAFAFAFTDGLAARGAIAPIVADRIRATIAAHGLRMPPVIVVDHGGPSPTSATLRNLLAAQIRAQLGPAIGPLAAASLEGADYAHNHPLLADQLTAPGFNHGHVVIAPLFLAPGRHAGPHGDLAQIARAAEDRLSSNLHCHVTDLVGTHPRVVDTLAAALRDALAARGTTNAPASSPPPATRPALRFTLPTESFV